MARHFKFGSKDGIANIYVIMLIRSMGGAFHFPAMNASTALMVPSEHLTRVQGANQTMQGVRGIVAPALGALVLSLLPMHAVMGIDVVTAALAVAPLFWVSIPQPKHRSQAPLSMRSLVGEVGEAVREALEADAEDKESNA